MRFKINFYGDIDPESPPCEGAILLPSVQIDRRTFKTPEEYDIKLGIRGKLWHEEGTNHRTWQDDGKRFSCKEGIARDFPCEDWFVEIEDLAGLVAFCAKYGKLTLRHDEQGISMGIQEES